MATIYNTIEKTAGIPREGVVVQVELVWDTSDSPVAYGDYTMIKGPYLVTSDTDGYWEVSNIVENDMINPSGSLYKVTEDSETIYYISVPSGATPTFWVGDLLESEPAWV